MTGIIHFSDLDRVEPRITRRAVITGATGAALMAMTRSASAQTPEPPDATPVGGTRGGTYLADARERLRSMLKRLPGSVIANRRDAVDLFTWVDYQTHFGTHDVTDPVAAGNLADLMFPLVSTDPLFQYVLQEETQSALGFSPLETHQVLSAGVPPERVTIYAGGVRFADLAGTWEAAGYERKTAEWGDYWTIGENAEPSLALGAPLGMGELNNVALLDDETAVFASTLELLTAVMVLADGGETAADDEGVSRLLEVMPTDAVSVAGVSGEAFRADAIVPENPGMESFTTAGELLAESDEAVGPMPRLLLSLCGVTAGAMAPGASPDGGTPAPQGSPDATAFFAFATASEDAAISAAEVAYWRLENMTSPTTGQVYNERFVPVTPVEDAVEGDVMIVRFGPDVAGTGAWATMIFSRDVWPFAWIGEM